MQNMAIKFSSIRLWLSLTEFTTESMQISTSNKTRNRQGPLQLAVQQLAASVICNFSFNSSPLFSYTNRSALRDVNPPCVKSAGHAECPTEQTDRYNSESEYLSCDHVLANFNPTHTSAAIQRTAQSDRKASGIILQCVMRM